MRPHRTQIALAAELANVESSLVTLKKATLKDDYRRRNLELGKIMWGLFDDIITRAATRSEVSQILDISKCADGMWSITQSSRTAYVVAFKAQSGTDKLIARNSSKTL